MALVVIDVPTAAAVGYVTEREAEEASRSGPHHAGRGATEPARCEWLGCWCGQPKGSSGSLPLAGERRGEAPLRVEPSRSGAAQWWHGPRAT